MQVHLKEGIKPISDFRKDSAKILRTLRTDHRPVLLTQRGRSIAVLLDPETYDELEYIRNLKLAVAGGLEDVRRGRVRKHEEVIEDLRKWARE